MAPDARHPDLPFPLSWAVPPERQHTEAGALTVTVPARTDLFVDPAGGDPVTNAPRLLGTPPPGDFQLSARVTVHFGQIYGAGVLLAWVDDRRWAKLCFEFSPDAEPMAVSVVTRDVSDDANAFTVAGSTLWLRLSRLGPALAFHASTDGTRWRFVRYFHLGAADYRVGFEVQSPLGDGCTATFDDIRFTPGRLADLRDGS